MTELSKSGAAVGEPTSTSPAPTSFLEVRDLKVHFPTDDGLVKSVAEALAHRVVLAGEVLLDPAGRSWS